MLEYSVARDGEEFAVRSNGGDWLTAWRPSTDVVRLIEFVQHGSFRIIAHARRAYLLTKTSGSLIAFIRSSSRCCSRARTSRYLASL